MKHVNQTCLGKLELLIYLFRGALLEFDLFHLAEQQNSFVYIMSQSPTRLLTYSHN